ncbi:MAG: ion channel [Leifsonia sp.]
MADVEAVGPARARWERVTTVPMFVVAAAFIAAYSLLVLLPDASGGVVAVLVVIIALTWVATAVDYIVRLVLSRHHRWSFVRHNVLDGLGVIFPFFRAFRLLKSLRDMPFFARRSGAAVRTQVVLYASLFAVLFVYMVSLAVLQAERDAPGATITSFGDSIWWACVTIATVGYGDMVPVTVPGRVFAVLLMVGGVVIVGTASATVISYLNERVASGHRRAPHASTSAHGPHDPHDPHSDRASDTEHDDRSESAPFGEARTIDP